MLEEQLISNDRSLMESINSSRSVSRNYGTTIHHEEFNDGSGILKQNGTELSGQDIVLSQRSPDELFRETSQNIYPSQDIGFRKNILLNGSDVYILHTIKTGPNVQLLIKNSSDLGENWSQRILVWKGKVDGILSDLQIWNGTIVVGFVPYSIGSPNKNDLLIKMAPSSDISLLESASSEKLVNRWVSDFEIIRGKDKLHVSVKESNKKNCVIHSYDGNGWNDGVTVVEDGNCASFQTEAFHETSGMDERLALFYSNHGELDGSNRTLNLKLSSETDGTFENNTIICPIGNNETILESLLFDDRIILISGGEEKGQINLLTQNTSRINGTWDETDLSLMGGSSGQNSIMDITAGIWNGRMIIACINDLGEAYYICSDETGSFSGSSVSSHPIDEDVFSGLSMTSNGNLILFCDIENEITSLGLYEIGKFEQQGSLRTKEFSPPMLEEWKEICIDAWIPAGTNILFRPVDGISGELIHPEEEWIEVSKLAPGDIEGIGFSHVLEVGGDWIQPYSISIEFMLEGDLNNTPRLERIALNYSTTRHYDDNLSTQLYIEKTDADWEPGRIFMKEGSYKHYLETEPLELEGGSWPDHISLQVSGVSNGDQIFIGLKDPITGNTIPGFSEGDCIMRTGLKNNSIWIPHWKDSILSSLPEDISSIVLNISLISGLGSGTLTLERIFTMDDREPSVRGYHVTPDNEVLRNSTVMIEVELEDDILEQSDLMVELEYRLPQEAQWENLLSGEGEYTEDRWLFDIFIPKGSSIGECNIRLVTTDMNPNREPLVFDMGSIMITNNIPSPPEIFIPVIEPKTGDDIVIEIIDPGTDIETSFKDLRFTFEWWLNGDLFSKFENTTDIISMIGNEMTEKGQNWKALVWSHDGINRSNEIEIDFDIRNSAPVLSSKDPDGFVISEDNDDLLIDLDSLFIDHDQDQISYDLYPGDHILSSLEGNTANIRPEHNWNGFTEIEIQAFDGEERINHTFPVQVTHINDPPENVTIDKPLNHTIRSFGATWNFTGSYSDPDEIYGQTIVCHWELDGMKMGAGISLSNVIIQPGIHNVTFIVTDGENNTVFSTILITVNDPVEDIIENEVDTNDNDTEPTPELPDDMEEIERSNEFCIFSLIGLSMIVIFIGSLILLIKKRHEKDLEYDEIMQAPPIDQMNIKNKEVDNFEDIDTDHIDTPELPVRSGENGNSHQRFVNENCKKKTVRTCLSSNGNTVIDKRRRSSISFSPYRFYKNSTSKSAERIVENDSYYIRPASPYTKP